MITSTVKAAIACSAVLLLGACASMPPELGRGEVDQLLNERGLRQHHEDSPQAISQVIGQLLAAPLTAESAVRIALLNNPQMAATYARLGFGAADVYAAGRIRNPVLSAALLSPNVSGERDQLTLGLVTSFTDLITLSSRKRLSAGAFTALKQSVAAEVLHMAATAERAFYDYVGSRQVSALRAQSARAMSLSATLAERFHQAGNINNRELAMQRAAASEARLLALETEREAFAARGHLAELMGLSVAANWEATASLHLPPAEEAGLDALLSLARASRLDLAAARTEAEVLADRLGVVNWTRWIGDLDAGIEHERETDGVRLTGPTLDWELPLFTRHQDDVVRARAEMFIAMAEVQRLTLDVENSVRLAYAGLLNARQRVNEYSEVLIPQRIESVARAQEEVNYMLIGVFELIRLKADEYDTYQNYLEAIRDYWLERTALTVATGNTLADSSKVSSEQIDVQQLIEPAAGSMDHSGHDMGAATRRPAAGSENETSQDINTATPTMDHSGHNMRQMQHMKTTRPAPDTADHSGHTGHSTGPQDGAVIERNRRDTEHDNGESQ